MIQHILSVAGTVFQASQQFDKLWSQTVDSNGKGCLFAGFLDILLNFFLGFFNHFFDTGRMNPSIIDELFKGDAGNFPAYGVKTGNNNCFRGIIDNQINACQGFQRTDVSAFPADDPAFHFIIGQAHYGNRSLRHLIGSTALDGQRNDVPGLFISLFFRALFHFLDHNGSVMLYIVADCSQQFLLRVFAA